MMRGAQLLLLAGSMLATGCAETQAVKVRAVADPAAKLGTGSELLGQARAQLALGNVGLALEALRQLQREQPENPDVFAGIAACYSAMGRFDVARQNLEFALAYSPDSPALLTALASTLDRLGENEQALQVRAEAARLSAPVATAEPATKQANITPLGVPHAGSITVKLPPPQPRVAAAQMQSLPQQQPQVQQQPEALAVVAIAPVELASATAKVDPLASGKVIVGERALHADVVPTIALPLPVQSSVALALNEVPHEPSDPAILKASMILSRQQPATALTTRKLEAFAELAVAEAAERLATAPQAERPAPMPAPAPAPEKQVAVTMDVRRDAQQFDDDVVPQTGPRLERTSLGEVELITAPRAVAPRLPVRKLVAQPTQTLALTELASAPKPSAPVQQAMAATSVRWLPLRYASAPQSVQLLNAARTDRLAAKTRIALHREGLRNIAIGNARRARQSSLVLYSAARTPVVRRLAAQFHCKALKVPGLRAVVVLLGRDAAMRRSDTAKA